MGIKIDTSALQDTINTLNEQSQALAGLKVKNDMSGGSGLCHTKSIELISAYNKLNGEAEIFVHSIANSLNAIKESIVKLDEDLGK